MCKCATRMQVRILGAAVVFVIVAVAVSSVMSGTPVIPEGPEEEGRYEGGA